MCGPLAGPCPGCEGKVRHEGMFTPPSTRGTLVNPGNFGVFNWGYDVATGRQLWQTRLPAGAQATPMTCADRNGKQYLLAAFALP